MSLKSIFQKAEKEIADNHEFNSNRFPFELLKLEEPITRKSVFCLISLSCTHCIDLLPELKRINDSNTFILVTDGTEEDNAEIHKYFNFTFPIISYRGPLNKLGTEKTPYLLLVNPDGQVMRQTQASDISEVMDMF